MQCNLEFSRAKNLASGKLKAEATVIHRPARLFTGTGSISALVNVQINVGFTNQQVYGSKNEELFGAAQQAVYTTTDSRNKLTCSGNFRILNSRHIKLQNNTTTYPINSINDIDDSLQSVNRVVDVKNPYCDINPSLLTTEENCNFKAFLILSSSSFQASAKAVSKLVNTYVDKIGGTINKILSIPNFRSTQKLYPIRDIETGASGVYFVDKELNSTNLYDSIDDGLFIGNYVENNNKSTRISDDANSFIQPSSVNSQGDFTYKCEVSAPLITPQNSFLFIRAAAPMVSYESDVPAIFKIHNIKLEDPSGNLIVKYKDIIFRGDGDFLNEQTYNFATYVTEPEINYASLHTWQPKFPILGEASGYTLNLDFNIDCIHTPFSSNFNLGYENECKLEEKFVESSENDYLAEGGSPISTRTQGFSLNPNNSLRISAIEIVNSGTVLGLLDDNYLPIHVEVQPTGNRLERTIYPSMIMSPDFDTGVEPSITSVWKSSDELGTYYYNTSSDGAGFLTTKLRDLFNFGYIELDSAPSGKLQLQYKHEPPFGIKQQSGGAFNFGSKTRSKGLNSSSYQVVYSNDSFFTIDSIELQILAKKAEGSPDYTLDVVGYSDDKVINVTSSKGGFLQNVSGGEGTLPLYSGFHPTDELALSAETLSDKDQYSEYTVANSGGDHFLISTYPVVSSVDFQKYTIPLKIYEDFTVLGSSKDYSMSSYFETLYLDIYPLPSGAAISKANLIIKYKPSNALPLHTLGYQENELAKRKLHLYPSPRKSIKDAPLNSNWQSAPLSLIENIPHAYKYPTTLKTNYSRRWRGVDGKIFSGPFDAIDFDFAFHNPQLEEPFLRGYFDFNNVNGDYVLSSSDSQIDLSGLVIGGDSNSLIKNIGLRFNSNSIFETQELPYKTLDWTYTGHELYGKILDSFDNAIRVSGDNCHINFGDISTASGFAIFTRFCPDYTISGVGYNLFNSGIIFSKWDAESDLEFVLGYNNGHLCAYATDSNNDIVYIEDSLNYTEYQYPLSIILTYNDNNSRKLKLYTDNEIYNGSFNTLRDSSDEFDILDGSSDLVFGNCYGGKVGINGFLTEIGISASGCNIVESNASSRLQQTTAESFLSTHRVKFWNNEESYENDSYKLWDFVNENTDDWYIGAFKYCDFFNSFDTLKTRVGLDFIVHNFSTNGETYADITDLTLPSSVKLSGVAYHSQIENDMLRFNLGGQADRFYAVAPRITKALPRGYAFNEEGFVVDTVIQHEATNDIVWADGTIGPRLIVSLYAKSKDSELFDTTNWGLINRSIHHINSDICWAKISSKFTLADLVDTESEPWSNFVTSRNITELNQKYFSKDINEMFLQYDLVYPSGSYSSKIKIHSAHVRLENALIKADTVSDQLYLAVSGETRPRETLSLSMPNTLDSANTFNDPNHGLTLYASGYLLVPQSGSMSLVSSGAYLLDNNIMPLHTVNIGYIGASQYSANTFGAFEGENLYGAQMLYGPNLYVAGRTDKNDDKTLALYLQNNQTLPNAFETLVLFTNNPPNPLNDRMSLSVDGGFAQWSFYINSAAPLYISSPLPEPKSSGVLPFSIDAISPYISYSSGSMVLNIFNHSSINAGVDQLESFLWNKGNVGKEISVSDNYLAYLDANDEIRGVETICYGSCDNQGTCTELSVVTHDTEWYPSECVDGGVIRALTTYTNPDVSGFKTPVGYSGHFYGIRKLDGLIPQAPYSISLIGKTGSDGILEVPREMSEWEYGYNQHVGYSGTKLISPDRLENSNYGKAVAIKDDLLAIGAPNQDIYDEHGYLLENAGSVYVYRRNTEPSGFDWSNQSDKSPWSLETVLTLPEGFKRDYYTTSEKIFYQDGNPLPFRGIEKQWIVGQEGRQLGHSLSMAKTNDREIIVAGAPSCSWTRTFDNIQPSSINVGFFIFTDEFLPTIPYPCNERLGCANYNNLISVFKEKDILFKYFCDPSVSFNITVIICEPVLDTNSNPSPDFDEPKPKFIQKYQIHRHQIYDRQSQTFTSKNSQILDDIKDVFHTAFPYDESKLHNNIPPILGFYVDNSISLGEKALQPALDQFIDYYKQYSYSSGLVDFNNNPSTGYAVKTVSIDENWIAQTNTLLSNVLNTGSMIENNVFKLFANNLGSFNGNASEFNVNPASGGSVFIYENSNNGWEIIQEIKSTTTSNNVAPDRFGHSVVISESGNIIAIGSPYTERAVSIYEYNPEAKNNKYNYFPSWLASKSASDSSTGYLRQLYTTFQTAQNSALINYNQLVRQTYDNMSQSGKLDFLHSLPDNVQEYSLIKTVNYSDIAPQGTWRFLADKYAPTSRLGYSLACNEDGSLVAIGAPTDSMGAQDNINIWYKAGMTRSTQWQSYVNAGCVRLLESRNYYPHNKVVEYGKFGNLFELNSPEEDSPFFDHMGTIYRNNFNLTFEKTSFAEVDIPQDAGTLFIITPAVDAASDEIIEKIQNWLALGDRNLVLVGNDPKWEEDGLYAKSNQIINYILQRLESRMRLHPARNKYESLLDKPSSLEFNASRASVPLRTTSTYVYPASLNASGAADIRLYYPQANVGYNCSRSINPIFAGTDYTDINDKCEMPIVHEGDLRAKWKEICYDLQGYPLVYEKNLSMYFGTSTPANYGCAEDAAPQSSTYQYEPIPIIAGIEKAIKTVTYPAIPDRQEYIFTRTLIPVQRTSNQIVFADNANEELAFIWSSESGNYSDLNTNIGLNTSKSIFYDPAEYNDHDALLMATSEVKNVSVLSPYIASDKYYYAVEENYTNANSKVVLIAGTYTESKEVLLSSIGDKNLNFYFNLVAKDKNGSSRIAQLGGWTNRISFKAGYQFSDLYSKLSTLGNSVDQNVSSYDLSDSSNGYDVCWIANTNEIPSDDDIERIKKWLNQGNKKLVITYGQHPDDPSQSNYNIQSANAVTYLCEKLGLSIKPLFLPVKNRYADLQDSNIQPVIGDIYINKNYESIYRGTRFGLIPDSTIETFSLEATTKNNIIPVQVNNGIPLADYGTYKVLDDAFVDYGKPLFKTGTVKVTFPVVGGSGYRIYYTTVSETPLEKIPLSTFISNCSLVPRENQTFSGIPYTFAELNANDEYVYLESASIGYLGKNTTENGGLRPSNYSGRPTTKIVDIQVPVSASSISIYVDANYYDFPVVEKPDTLRTTRLLAISGALLPIESKTLTYGSFEIGGLYDIVTISGTPARTETVEYIREISTDSKKYCPNDFCKNAFGDTPPDIADGPVLVAQEIYHQKPFDAGVAKSRITVISDPSLIQGRSIADENGHINPQLVTFLGSLYPVTTFPDVHTGRQYSSFTKIVNPEKLSPQKLVNAYQNSGLSLRFNGTIGNNLSSIAFSDTDYSLDVNSGGYASPYLPEAGLPPTYTTKRTSTLDTLSSILAARNVALDQFANDISYYGAYSKFNGIINNRTYEDASVYGGMPDIMKDTGHDYLDFDYFPSGYPGDLFGFSLAIKNNKLYIGAPFAAFSGESITRWQSVNEHTLNGNTYNTEAGFNGGAGAVYVFEKNYKGSGINNTATAWGLTKKLRPSEINIGNNNNIIGDQFGYAISIDGDILAIGAPGHDYDNHAEDSEASFIRKEFNEQFDVQKRTVVNLGSQSNRNEYGSGIVVQNNGAVFTYENKIKDWGSKTQDWVQIHKLVPQGYLARNTINDNFGKAVAIDRTRRKDADYTLVAGAPNHDYGSGLSQSTVNNAGASYLYDGMLRKLRPSFAHPDSFIAGRLFGSINSDDPYMNFSFTNSGVYDYRFYFNDIIYSNENGEIFLEVSGQDKISKGFIVHRPYIDQIKGSYYFGTQRVQYGRLFIEGRPLETSSNLPLINNAIEYGNVYNSIGLYEQGVLGISSGTDFSLYTSGNYIDFIEQSGLTLCTSGTDISSDILPIYIRGKF